MLLSSVDLRVSVEQMFFTPASLWVHSSAASLRKRLQRVLSIGSPVRQHMVRPKKILTLPLRQEHNSQSPRTSKCINSPSSWCLHACATSPPPTPPVVVLYQEGAAYRRKPVPLARSCCAMPTRHPHSFSSSSSATVSAQVMPLF